jgi:hypothetical protein
LLLASSLRQFPSCWSPLFLLNAGPFLLNFLVYFSSPLIAPFPLFPSPPLLVPLPPHLLLLSFFALLSFW